MRDNTSDTILQYQNSLSDILLGLSETAQTTDTEALKQWSIRLQVLYQKIIVTKQHISSEHVTDQLGQSVKSQQLASLNMIESQIQTLLDHLHVAIKTQNLSKYQSQLITISSKILEFQKGNLS
ncbi:hypothetical protein [Butyrivibrio sp.]|uniref:hypothetical protein n=1 Tax=Butyrivibrio sp. TaxID=28121 RepID=UPI0025C0887F|nr:hypothetical protein [Butyrivibrio sp.]MBQ9304124.1 hypothetical protein [Butyrivibrio sp.]